MRGKELLVVESRRHQRITPADAGKSFFGQALDFINEDHPRRCGEKLFVLLSIKIAVGSPPQMRGKEQLPQAVRLIIRITPADAGKSREALRQTR